MQTARLYRAKEEGRNNFQIYTEAMNAAALEQMTLENSLRKALEREGVSGCTTSPGSMPIQERCWCGGAGAVAAPRAWSGAAAKFHSAR